MEQDAEMFNAEIGTEIQVEIATEAKRKLAAAFSRPSTNNPGGEKEVRNPIGALGPSTPIDSGEPVSKKSKKDGAFRLQSTQVFLTWPRCNVIKEEALRQLEEKAEIAEYVVASEKHKVNSDVINVWRNGVDGEVAKVQNYISTAQTCSHKLADALCKDLLDDNWRFY